MQDHDGAQVPRVALGTRSAVGGHDETAVEAADDLAEYLPRLLQHRLDHHHRMADEDVDAHVACVLLVRKHELVRAEAEDASLAAQLHVLHLAPGRHLHPVRALGQQPRKQPPRVEALSRHRLHARAPPLLPAPHHALRPEHQEAAQLPLSRHRLVHRCLVRRHLRQQRWNQVANSCILIRSELRLVWALRHERDDDTKFAQHRLERGLVFDVVDENLQDLLVQDPLHHQVPLLRVSSSSPLVLGKMVDAVVAYDLARRDDEEVDRVDDDDVPERRLGVVHDEAEAREEGC
mmetsp:Transcript_55928/g.131689  ORF Transcript_55928/g.131689 Transcript_55928/m.131689 type:complete len:291 (-) Transcript_55928:3190-4062(-)